MTYTLTITVADDKAETVVAKAIGRDATDLADKLREIAAEFGGPEEPESGSAKKCGCYGLISNAFCARPSPHIGPLHIGEQLVGPGAILVGGAENPHDLEGPLGLYIKNLVRIDKASDFVAIDLEAPLSEEGEECLLNLLIRRKVDRLGVKP